MLSRVIPRYWSSGDDNAAFHLPHNMIYLLSPKYLLNNDWPVDCNKYGFAFMLHSICLVRFLVFNYRKRQAKITLTPDLKKWNSKAKWFWNLVAGGLALQFIFTICYVNLGQSLNLFKLLRVETIYHVLQRVKVSIRWEQMK